MSAEALLRACRSVLCWVTKHVLLGHATLGPEQRLTQSGVRLPCSVVFVLEVQLHWRFHEVAILLQVACVRIPIASAIRLVHSCALHRTTCSVMHMRIVALTTQTAPRQVAAHISSCFSVIHSLRMYWESVGCAQLSLDPSSRSVIASLAEHS